MTEEEERVRWLYTERPDLLPTLVVQPPWGHPQIYSHSPTRQIGAGIASVISGITRVAADEPLVPIDFGKLYGTADT